MLKYHWIKNNGYGISVSFTTCLGLDASILTLRDDYQPPLYGIQLGLHIGPLTVFAVDIGGYGDGTGLVGITVLSLSVSLVKSC